LLADTQANIVSLPVDFRVKDPTSSAVYTLVLVGLLNGQPGLQLLSFLDAGELPTTSSSPAGGLTAVQIALIVVGVLLFVIAVGAIGFIVWKKRSRAGYSEIETTRQE